MATPLTTLETLLRAKKLDVTLTSARPWLQGESRDERAARLASTGWPTVDAALGGGFPRGECSEIVGPASSGRTAVMCALMAAAGARGEVMALIDTLDGFDPVSAAAMDLDLSRLLWVRGTMIRPTQTRAAQIRPVQNRNQPVRNLSAALGTAPAPARSWPVATSPVATSSAVRSPAVTSSAARSPALSGATPSGATPSISWSALSWSQVSEPARASSRPAHAPRRPDAGSATRSHAELLARVVDRAIKSFGLVLQAGGFGLVVLDLADVPMTVVRRLPFTTWLRVQRLIEGRETVGLVLAQEPIARSARGVTMRLGPEPVGVGPVSAGLVGAASVGAAPVGSGAVRWSGVDDRARRCVGYAVRPRISSAHRIDRER